MPPMTAGSTPPPHRPKPAPQKVKVVEAAPEADVENDDDLDPDGKCADFMNTSSCKDVKLGEGKVAECVSALIAAAEAGGGDDGETEVVPEDCEDEVYSFYINRSKNINFNVPLAKACKLDAEKMCNATWFFGPTEGRVIACLREAKDQVTNNCRVQLFKAQRAAARDYRADPAIREACGEDVKRLCGSDVKEGGGRKQACLREKHLQLTWECAEQLFRQELEAGDDLRLSVRLYQRCLPDKKRFCADVEPGQAEAKDCLISHRHDPKFDEGCREELDSMIERRVRDFRLDSRLRRNCQQDIVGLCGMLDAIGGDETDINICLQDYVKEIRNDKCKSLVRQFQGLAAQDIRFDVPLADACFDDRTKLCANVPPGSARVIRCLQKQREALSSLCRATLFDEEVRFSENIDFQFPMKAACTKEIKQFCAKVPHGNARVIRCLQENKAHKEFGSKCAEEVTAYEQRASQDYRLNHRLRTECKADVAALCKEACKKGDGQPSDDVCGGTVLRCLTEKQDDIKAEGCRREVLYYLKMEVRDYHNDVILATACRLDVEQFCKDARPGGQGGVHQCLRKHRGELSEGCRREELRLEAREAESIELRPTLLKACASERGLFCRDVQAGNARVFRCLADHLADPDFGPVCRGEVISKVQRRQANWRLDPPLRKACRADVASMCGAESEQNTETGLVYKCLVAHAADLDPGCKRELGRALHMAFFIWIPGSILTQPCDVDVGEVCLKVRPNMLHSPGEVGECMAQALERIAADEAGGRKDLRESAAAALPPALTPECRPLIELAAPPNLKAAFEEGLVSAALGSRLAALEAAAPAPLVARDDRGRAQGLTLTGWSAVAGVAALVVALLAAAGFALRHVLGLDSPTLVLKQRAGYKRVDTAAS
ncbi:MAG: hypothetical protein J3K34DRAFT_379960 [Monoraphidium minutum]|nr:MAG: hypothetical protein J3K34DRAFT_379960 [Monoraphidium minutum]